MLGQIAGTQPAQVDSTMYRNKNLEQKKSSVKQARGKMKILLKEEKSLQREIKNEWNVVRSFNAPFSNAMEWKKVFRAEGDRER